VVFIREKLDGVEKEFTKTKVNLSFREIKVMNHVKKLYISRSKRTPPSFFLGNKDHQQRGFK
jgi:hypothetical protein